MRWCYNRSKSLLLVGMILIAVAAISTSCSSQTPADFVDGVMNGQLLRIPSGILFGPLTHVGEDVWREDSGITHKKSAQIAGFGFALDPVSLRPISFHEALLLDGNAAQHGALSAIKIDVRLLPKKEILSPKAIYERYAQEFTGHHGTSHHYSFDLLETDVRRSSIYGGSVIALFLSTDGKSEISCSNINPQHETDIDFSSCITTINEPDLSAYVDVYFDGYQLKDWKLIQAASLNIISSFKARTSK